MATCYALDVGMGRSTVSKVVEEVTEAIIRVLHSAAFPRLTRERLEEVARRAQEIFDYPRAVGFMDGKHISLQKPARSGSAYWNYKHYHSIILLAICDCDHRIMAYDIGAPGRAGDAGVFRSSVIKRYLDRHDEIFPLTADLGQVGPVQFHFLVNGGFAQSHRFIRPYRQREANTRDRKRFNKKLSQARQTIESTFGMLAQRFQILMTRLTMDPDRVKRLVTSFMILHNLLPRRDDSLAGVQRHAPAPNSYHPLQRGLARESGSIARDRITQYYVDRDGPAR